VRAPVPCVRVCVRACVRRVPGPQSIVLLLRLHSGRRRDCSFFEWHPPAHQHVLSGLPGCVRGAERHHLRLQGQLATLPTQRCLAARRRRSRVRLAVPVSWGCLHRGGSRAQHATRALCPTVSPLLAPHSLLAAPSNCFAIASGPACAVEINSASVQWDSLLNLAEIELYDDAGKPSDAPL
jgi:hypothetical protein